MEAIQPKLTKLLEGELEGERFFFEEAARLAALAVAVRLTESELLALRGVRTLVLDPLLLPATRDYFVSRATVPDARHHCIVVLVEGDEPRPISGDLGAPLHAPPGQRERLRDALRAAVAENPGCIVVLASKDDRAYYEGARTIGGAKIDVTGVRPHPRGYVLVAAPELVPPPPPPPPRLFDHDGTPMVPSTEFAEEARKVVGENPAYGHRPREPESALRLDGEQSSVIAKRLAWAAEQETEPIFRIDEIGPWLVRQDGDREPAPITWVSNRRADSWSRDSGRGSELALHCFDAVAGEVRRTLVWGHGGEVFALGPRAARVAEVLAPHHAVKTPECLTEWRTGLGTRNPWLARRRPAKEEENAGWWPGFCKRAERECGIDPHLVFDRWLARVNHEERKPDTWTVTKADDAIDAARARLRELMGRAFALALRDVAILFRLELASEAPLVRLPTTPPDELHVVAHVGGGHVLRVRTMRFPAESPVPLTVLTPNDSSVELDGGDIHVWLAELPSDRMLEGSSAGAARRREQAAADDD